MKKNLLVASVAIVTTGLFSASAFAASTNGNAAAIVLSPLAITAGTGMHFGTVAGDTGTATTVVLTSAGGTSSGDGATVGGSPTAGAFSVTGDDNLAYDITFPGSVSLAGDLGGSVTVDTFTSSKAGDTSTTSGGADNFTVGATLRLADGQGNGNYTGTYSVTVDYQ